MYLYISSSIVATRELIRNFKQRISNASKIVDKNYRRINIYEFLLTSSF